MSDGFGLTDGTGAEDDIGEVVRRSRPNRSRRYILPMVVASVLALSAVWSVSPIWQSDLSEPELPAGLKAYIPHAAIVIGSNADFVSQGWPGNGNQMNPYVISGLEIDGLGFQDGIFISNTTVHYTIQGCYIYNSWQAGVFLYNAPDGKVLDCVLTGNSPFGIRISSSSGMSVINDTCTGASEAGISVDAAPGTVITGNTCSGCGEGIEVLYSNGCTISGNVCQGNSGDGIYAQGSDHVVTQNTCGDNGREGIEVHYGSGLLIAENWCSNNILLLTAVDNSNVSRNIVNRGIEAWASSHNDINNNTCTGSSTGISVSGTSVLGSPENLIADNNCSGCWQGIAIWPSAYDGSTVNVSGANTLARNDCTNCTIGIYLHITDYALLIDNNCSDSSVGVELEQSHWTVIRSTVLVRDSAAGVLIRDSTYATLRDNLMVSAGISIVGDTAPEWALQDIDTSNTVNGLPVRYVKGALSGQVVTGYGQVIVAASKNLEVRNQVIDNATTGIALGFCNNVTVANSYCTNNSLVGILFDRSENCTASDNVCGWNKDGMRLETSASSLVTNNTCTHNAQSGITVLGSFENMFYGNNTIRNNTCSYNTLDGILVQWSQYNEIYYNLLLLNLRYGVYLSSPSPWRMPYPIYTQFNLIYGNSFMGNHGGTAQALDGGQNNWWNLTASGNYWDDHQTPDANGDGIVDTPYPVGNSYDYYPLTSYPPSPIPEMEPVVVALVAAITGLVLCVWSRRRR